VDAVVGGPGIECEATISGSAVGDVTLVIAEVLTDGAPTLDEYVGEMEDCVLVDVVDPKIEGPGVERLVTTPGTLDVILPIVEVLTDGKLTVDEYFREIED